MDDGLVRNLAIRQVAMGAVLILVVVDDGLVRDFRTVYVNEAVES